MTMSFYFVNLICPTTGKVVSRRFYRSKYYALRYLNRCVSTFPSSFVEEFIY